VLEIDDEGHRQAAASAGTAISSDGGYRNPIRAIRTHRDNDDQMGEGRKMTSLLERSLREPEERCGLALETEKER
jgi:hypothetical protein